jgi:hypothetical protein
MARFPLSIAQVDKLVLVGLSKDTTPAEKFDLKKKLWITKKKG